MQQTPIVASNFDFAVNRQKSIVVVENERTLREKIANALIGGGFSVYATESGADALAYVRDNNTPHLVILDVLLENMDSVDLAKQLTKRGEVVLFFISTNHEPELIAALIERYGEDFLCKPFAIAELVARVQRIALRMPRFSTKRVKLVATKHQSNLALAAGSSAG